MLSDGPAERKFLAVSSCRAPNVASDFQYLNEMVETLERHEGGSQLRVIRETAPDIPESGHPGEPKPTRLSTPTSIVPEQVDYKVIAETSEIDAIERDLSLIPAMRRIRSPCPGTD